MTHLNSQQLLAVAEHESLDESAAQHLATCAGCRVRVDDIRAVIVTVAAGREIPEPSPLFWDHFSARVRAAIAGETAEPRLAIRQVAWTLGAAVAAAAIVIAVSIGSKPAPRDKADAPRMASTADPSGAIGELPVDASWQLIADLTPAMDWDAADEAGIVHPGTSERALLDLSDAERDELKRLLRTELSRTHPSS